MWRSMKLGWRMSPWLAMLVCSLAQAQETRVPVTFTGGHETDRRDGGRPVALVAGALGVTPEQFREAFRGVTPARNGGPTGEQARANKSALMKVLRPLGVNNDRLDEVSNYYRYRPQAGEMWPVTAARAEAVLVNGKVKEVVVKESGSGYLVAPVAKVKDHPEIDLQVSLHFDKDFKKNGSVTKIEAAAAK